MKVEIRPGVVVQLDQRKSTSTAGGTYDLAGLKISDADVKRILATKGVSEVKTTPAKKTEDGK